MKKIYSILALAIITFAFAMADDNIKVLRVFKGENVTTIPLAYVDSIDHSKYDADSVLWDTYKTSVLWVQDSVFLTPLEELDSIVIEDVSVQRLTAEMDNIKDHLATLDNQPLDVFQANLLSWFNNECDYVEKATLSPSGEHIIVQLKDGIDIYVSFVNTDKIVSDEENDTNNTRLMEESREEQRYFDVSTIPDEEIINPNILYIQGRSMPSFEDESSKSSAGKEWNKLIESFEASPINGNITPIFKSLSFLYEDFSKYGLIIISQTHGSDGRNGNFQVEDVLQAKWWHRKFSEEEKEKQICLRPVITVYVNKNGCKIDKKSNVFWVIAKDLRTKFRNNPVFASYCYSGYLGNGPTNATIYGYENSIWYWYGKDIYTPATDSLIVSCNRFFNGYPYNDAVWLNLYNVNGDVQIPMISANGDCKIPLVSNDIQVPIKHRYFSISIDPITRRNNKGNPIITGKIHGYKNLKSWLPYYVYSHEGNDSFTPESSNVQSTRKGVNIDSEGNFTYEYGGDKYLNTIGYNETYGFMIGFEHDGKVYHGNIEYFTNNLCPDSNHPHMIDLGLPSGTKWSCCNVGASKPGEYGGYYSWGNTQESEEYDWKHTNWIDNSVDYVVRCEKYDPKIDNKCVLDPEDDAATANWGNAWRMPTSEECEELCENTTIIRYGADDVSGFKLSGSNGNSIFMPSAGYKWGSSSTVKEEGPYGVGEYWSSSLSKDNSHNAQYLAIRQLYEGAFRKKIMEASRYNGYSIRPVANN